MKVAVITGTSSGLGEAFAQALLDLGWKVYGISRRENVELSAHSNFRQVQMDLSKALDLSLLDKEIGEKHLDLLVNNAGLPLIRPAEDWNQEDHDKIFSVHYTSPLNLLSYFTPKLKDGMVISILSTASHVGWPELAHYGASKAALWLYMKSFAAGNPSIACFALHPSMVTTELTDSLGDYFDKEERTQFMKPKEVVTIFLQLITGALSLPSGSSIFIHNDLEKGEVIDVGKDMYDYNTDTEKINKV